ncbi:MAG TPA: sigma-54 dependent transcriptional regulator [Candidatus Binatia bacterium]|nr:sigma-54 dependent transcriptional regulator [Candidatus Binatia bacterium]
MGPITETILVADDDEFIQEALMDRLQALGYHVLQATDGAQALHLIERRDPQMAFLDIEMPGMKGMEVLREIRRREKNLPVVMITAYGTIDLAVEAMKEGAYDFIAKPFKGTHVALLVQKALEEQRLRREVQILAEEVDKRYHLVPGTSAKFTSVANAAKKAAVSNSTVLLLGESGTGKELFARAIHNWSDRRERPFVAINCVGLSKELLESELFGHERGAFTGAQQRKRGKLELAQSGTVFLDEVGDMSEEIQTKLLRFLQEREFERVGGTDVIRVDVRIIAATNRDLQKAVHSGKFRDDLYYRLNVVPLALPPLRERKEDIPPLVRYFLERFGQESKKKFTEVSTAALEKLVAYDWPGNVRELANVLERAVVLGQPPLLEIDDLPQAMTSVASDNRGASIKPYYEMINDFRRQVISAALAQTQGNQAAAARVLGLQRTYLSRLVRSLGIR